MAQIAREVIEALTAPAAIAALVFALVNFEGRINAIQHSRQLSAQDNCYLLRNTVLTATPRPRHASAVAYLDNPSNPLHDCVAYGRHVRTLGVGK